jgi:hypothetical protein
MVSWLGNAEATSEAAVLIAHNWFLLGSAERKVRIQQPGRSTFYIQLARAHPHFYMDHVRFIEFNGFRNVQERARIG